MSTTKSLTTRITVLAVALAAMMAIAIAPAASAKTLKVKKTGGTTLKIDASTAEALTSLGVSVAPIKPAKAAGGGVRFPVTGGKLDSKTLAGNIRHSGGLRFSNGTTNVDLTRFTINIDAQPDLVATVGGKRVSILNLDLSGLKNGSKGKSIKLSGVKASLTADAAAALNGAFGVTAFTEGLALGTASVKTTVK